MIESPIYCQNLTSRLLSDEPVTVGVPFARGLLTTGKSLALRDQSGQLLPLQTKPLSRWPDGSIKWLLCDFFADLPSGQQSAFQLTNVGASTKEISPLQAVSNDKGWQVNTGAARFIIDGKVLRPFVSVQVDDQEILGDPAEVQLYDDQGRPWTPQVDQLQLEEQGPVRLSFRFSGGFRRGKRELLRFEARLQFYAGSARSLFEVRVHNPRAAHHPGNLWDLGDLSSVLLRQWRLCLPLQAERKPRLRLQTETDGPWQELSASVGGCLLQDSSGGENWQSPVHRAADGQVGPSLRGWKLTGNGVPLVEGLRAQPLACWDRVGVSIDHFWQRFPKALSLTGQGVELDLLPAIENGSHELQGGEQLTERMRFDFTTDTPAAGWGDAQIAVRCGLEVYRQSDVLTDGLWPAADSRYQSLLAVALDDEKGFFAKREQIDEYGWRHFGELYADHEAAFHKQARPFVSHYNNQYDPLAAFYRQFLAGGDSRWGELARDLVAHVADIDLNHTDRDREEYCHGLFWHTDHYLDAGLSTHRMASREHLSQKNPAFCGGGPAAEHCYTSGLTLHHLHSGDPRSRELVLQLADWCWRSLRGPQTLCAALLRSVKSLARWRREGAAAPIWPRYPFTRGTGNCLNATLDALELTGDRRYLKRATKLVLGTVHPADRPQERDLLNAELRWSYTVFLAALGRYLQVKVARNELDNDYAYGRASLLTYSRWMAEHEYPYLDKPETLEYPNETWAAQDLRKSVVFYQAAGHAAAEERARFRERSRFFLDAGLDHLCASATRHYTRPLALVLQNGWTAEALTAEVPVCPAPRRAPLGRPTPRLTFGAVLRRSLADLLAVLPQTGPRREWRWLKARLGRG